MVFNRGQEKRFPSDFLKIFGCSESSSVQFCNHISNFSIILRVKRWYFSIFMAH